MLVMDSLLLGVLYSGIYNGVQDINKQIDEDEETAENYNDALDYRKVSPHDALYCRSSNAGPGINLLHNY
jgi:hypothetical protein